jgi:8-oxo-dGTP diphosphatase
MIPSAEWEQKITVAVAGIIRDREGRILLVKHSDAKRGGFWYGKWICPGGRLEVGESLAEGVAREIREETNLDVRVSTDPFVLDRVVRQGSATRLHVVCVNFTIESSTGNVSAGSDAGAARWFTKKELRERRKELHEDTVRQLGRAGVLGT